MSASRFSGAQLRAARIAAGVRPEVLAVRVGRSVHSNDAYELGHVVPPLDVALALAESLGVSIYDFLTPPSATTVSRAGQGLPPVVEDPVVLERVATLMGSRR